MNITSDTEVYCPDGYYGCSTCLIWKPAMEQVTHHDEHYPLTIFTLEAESTRYAWAPPFLAAPIGVHPVNSDVRVYVVDDLTTKNGENNDE